MGSPTQGSDIATDGKMGSFSLPLRQLVWVFALSAPFRSISAVIAGLSAAEFASETVSRHFLTVDDRKSLGAPS